MPSEPPLPPPRPPAGSAAQPPRGPSPGLQPTLDQGVRVAGDERAPEVDGPARRTSPLTLVPVALAIIPALILMFSSRAAQVFAPSSNSSSSTSTSSGSGFLVFVLVPFALGAVIAALGWVFRTYTVATDELVIDQGVLARHRRVVPYGRVQQIDVHQGLVDRVLGTATLKVETAGSGEGTAKLGLLDVRLARGIRHFALRRRAEIQGRPRGDVAPSPQWAGAAPWIPGSPTPHTVTGRPEQVLVQLGPGRLAAAGLTHHWVVGAVVLALPIALVVAALSVSPKGLLSVLAVVALALVAAVAVAVAAGLLALLQYVVGQYGFTLAESDDDLHVRFGLFQTSNLTIPRRRVQHVTVVDNPVRRALGLASIELHSASPGGGGGDASSSSRFEIPIVARADIDGLLTALMGGDWRIGELTPRPVAAKRRAVTRRVALGVAVAIAPMAAFPPWSLLFILVAALGVPWGLAAHRRAGSAVRHEVVALAHGVVRHHVELLPHSRIQSAFTVQSPFQRMSRLCTLHVNVAGRSSDPHLYDMDVHTALGLARDLPRRSVEDSEQPADRAGRFGTEAAPF